MNEEVNSSCFVTKSMQIFYAFCFKTVLYTNKLNSSILFIGIVFTVIDS